MAFFKCLKCSCLKATVGIASLTMKKQTNKKTARMWDLRSEVMCEIVGCVNPLWFVWCCYPYVPVSSLNRCSLCCCWIYWQEARACRVEFRAAGFREEIQAGSNSHTRGPRVKTSAADRTETFPFCTETGYRLGCLQ